MQAIKPFVFNQNKDDIKQMIKKNISEYTLKEFNEKQEQELKLFIQKQKNELLVFKQKLEKKQDEEKNKKVQISSPRLDLVKNKLIEQVPEDKQNEIRPKHKTKIGDIFYTPELFSGENKMLKDLKNKNDNLIIMDDYYLNKFVDCIYTGLNLTQNKDKIIIEKYLKGKYESLQNILKIKSVLLYNCTLPITYKYLTSGSYGSIYTKNTEPNKIFKFPILQRENLPGCLNYEDPRNLRDLNTFLEESIINIILYCSFDFIKLKFSTAIQYFPKIYGIYLNESNKPYSSKEQVTIFCEMEKLDMGLADYLYYYKNDIKESVSILLQIIDAIYILQNSIKFMHRDFHTGNIMLRKNKEKMYVLHNGVVLKNQKYSVVFIDFGMCCVEIPSKNYCISGGLYECKGKKCNFNPSTDLRLLFSSLCELDINPSLKKIINSIFLKPEYIKMEKREEKVFKHKFHYYYDDKTVSQDFIPQNLMKQLLDNFPVI